MDFINITKNSDEDFYVIDVNLIAAQTEALIEEGLSLAGLGARCPCGDDSCGDTYPKSYNVMRLSVAAFEAVRDTLPDNNHEKTWERLLDDITQAFRDDPEAIAAALLYSIRRSNQFEYGFLKLRQSED